MKNKTKGLIALIAMTAAAAAAAGSSTFAWFQTNRSANLSFNKITIKKRGANELEAKLLSLGTGTLSENDSKLTVAAPNAEASDISSKDGVQLYAPVWGNKVGDQEKVTRVDEVIDTANSKANQWFTEFGFQVKNVKHGTDTTKLNVFFDDRTLLSAVEVEGYVAADETNVLTYEAAVEAGTIEMGDDMSGAGAVTYDAYTDSKPRYTKHKANEAAKNWSRVAIISVSEKPATHAAVGKGKLSQTGVLTFENEISDTENSSEEFVIGTERNADDTMKIDEYETTDRHYYTFADPETYYDYAHVEYASMNDAAKAGYLTTLNPDQTAYFIVRVWLEGTENDDQEIADGGEIELNLGLTSYGIAAA